MKLKSYAKINLSLHIHNKQASGYHELTTVLQQVDLHDSITLTRSDKGLQLTCSESSLENEQNLAYKAADLLKKKYNISSGVTIHIEKRIPIGSGLSGGSSNAATVLKGLNTLWKLQLDSKEIMELGSSLGMDVPFHILGKRCTGSHYGEQVKSLAIDKHHYVVIAYPGFSISTQSAYSNVLPEQYSQGTQDLTTMYNSFETSLFSAYPQLRDLKELLGPQSLVSGSGSSVFGLYDTHKKALLAAEKITSFTTKVYVTEMIT